VRIREARPDDWPEVAPLLRELGRPEDPGAQAVFDGYLRRADTVALVAEERNRIIGFLDMEYRTRLGFAQPQAWIPDLVVAEDGRGQGVGAALIRRAEAMAGERGCWGISLESANWRRGSHAFYIRQGWRDTGESFTKALSDRPWPPAPPDDVTAGRSPPG
jgi:GNAT superfamily N-acetyltransferase